MLLMCDKSCEFIGNGDSVSIKINGQKMNIQVFNLMI